MNSKSAGIIVIAIGVVLVILSMTIKIGSDEGNMSSNRTMLYVGLGAFLLGVILIAISSGSKTKQ